MARTPSSRRRIFARRLRANHRQSSGFTSGWNTGRSSARNKVAASCGAPGAAMASTSPSCGNRAPHICGAQPKRQTGDGRSEAGAVEIQVSVDHRQHRETTGMPTIFNTRFRLKRGSFCSMMAAKNGVRRSAHRSSTILRVQVPGGAVRAPSSIVVMRRYCSSHRVRPPSMAHSMSSGLSPTLFSETSQQCGHPAPVGFRQQAVAAERRGSDVRRQLDPQVPRRRQMRDARVT